MPYARYREVNFFSDRKAKPRKKNSSRRELIKDIYSETNTKLSLFTPMLFSRETVICDKSNRFIKEKYAANITLKTPTPMSNDIKKLFFSKENNFFKDILFTR